MGAAGVEEVRRPLPKLGISITLGTELETEEVVLLPGEFWEAARLPLWTPQSAAPNYSVQAAPLDLFKRLK